MNPMNFLPGDCALTTKGLLFDHPIIAIGEGWFIEKATNGEVRRRHHAQFPKDTVFALRYRPPASEAQWAVRRAEARLGLEKYCVLTSNCQHFVSEIYTGERRSEQVESISIVALVGLAFAALASAFSS